MTTSNMDDKLVIGALCGARAAGSRRRGRQCGRIQRLTTTSSLRAAAFRCRGCHCLQIQRLATSSSFRGVVPLAASPPSSSPSNVVSPPAELIALTVATDPSTSVICIRLFLLISLALLLFEITSHFKGWHVAASKMNKLQDLILASCFSFLQILMWCLFPERKGK